MDWKLKNFKKDQYELLKKQGVAPLFCSLVSSRNLSWIKNKKDIGTFIESPIEKLESPSSISNIEEASKIFANINGKHAVIFGDYDADGIISSYMCERLLINLEAKSVSVFLPSRIEDGYGLNEISVNNFIKLCKKDYSLVVILDCGSSSKKQIDKIKQHIKNAKIIVIDHHIINEEERSNNANCLINPRNDNVTPYCTGGLMYQMVRQCANLKNINHLNYIAYSAIATIADVCPMIGSNRIIVKNGLHALKFCRDEGINALFKVAEIDKNYCTTEDIGYRIGPMINASGRIKLASKALQLLEKKDKKSAMTIAKFLKDLNEQRKSMQKTMTSEAIDMFEKNRNNRNSAILYNKNWNPGIVGIVASKICDKYNIPTLCFGNQDGLIKGSARSIEQINIKTVMDKCSKIFIKYGGHEMAAGATLNPDFIDSAWDIFDKSVEEYKKENKVNDPIIEYDYEMNDDFLIRLDDVFCDRLSTLEPYGQGNEMPVFRANNLFCRSVNEWKNGTGSFIELDNITIRCMGLGNFKPMLNKKSDIIFCIVRSFIDGSKWMIKIIDYHVI